MDPYAAVTTGLTELEQHDLAPVSHGAVKETYALSGPREDEDYIVQVAAPGDGRVRLAAELYDRVAEETSIPTPAVLDRGWEHDTVPYIVMERSAGDNIEHSYGEMDPDRVDTIVDQAGAYLGEAHASLELDGYGFLEADGLEGTHDDWRQFMDEHIAGHCADLAGTVFDPGALMLRVDQAWDRHRDVVPEQPEATVVHNDYRPGNLLVDDDTITTVLDWDNAYAGDALYDYVMAELDFISPDNWEDDRNAEVRDRFREGYERHHAVEDGQRQDFYRMAAWLSEAKAFQWFRAGGHSVPQRFIDRTIDGLKDSVETLEQEY